MAVGNDEECAMTLPPDDEYELEIEREPLEESGAGPHAAAPGSGAPLAGLRRLPRRREVEALAVVGALALAVVIVLNSIRGAAPETSIAPTKMPVPQQVVLASNVTFGAFTLNGKLLKGPPPRLVTLRRDMNTITLAAPPFQPKTCTLVWPGQQPVGNACQTETGDQAFVIGGQTVVPQLALYVLVGTGDLAPPLVQAAVGAVASVLRGDYFATKGDTKGAPVARRAASAMDADLTFLPPSGTADGAGPCESCGFWPVPFDSSRGYPLPDYAWLVAVNVPIQWSFTPPGEAPLVAAPIMEGVGVELSLVYDGAGGWQATLPPGFGAGVSLGEQLRRNLCFVGVTLLNNVSGAQQHQYAIGTDNAKDHGVDGCVIQLFPNDGSSPSTPSGDVIWRFGALLAADPGAHKLLPTLPIAPDDEIKAVTA